MTFHEYFKQFTGEGIANQVAVMKAKRQITLPYYTKVTDKFSTAGKGTDASKMMGPFMARTLRYIIVYELVRLDKAQFYLLSGTRNMELSAKDLVIRMRSMDLRMLNMGSLETMRSVTSVMVALTMLQCMTLRKTSEFKTMSSLKASLVKETLQSSFSKAQEMFNDNVHYAKMEGHSWDIMEWFNPVVKAPIKPSMKAF